MTEFSLIKSLENPGTPENTPLPRGHKYQQMTFMVEGHERIAHIPAREVATVEQEALKELSEHDFKVLLRKHRGIRG